MSEYIRSHPALSVGLAIIVCAAAVTFAIPASATPAGGYDQSQFESTGPQLTAQGMAQSFSADGAYSVFESNQKLTADAEGDLRHVYRRRSADGSLELVSRRISTATIGSSFGASISADGNWVAYTTDDAGVFDDGHADDGTQQVALVDMSTGAVTRVSTPSPDVAVPLPETTTFVRDTQGSWEPVLAADGIHVVFTSDQSGMGGLLLPEGETAVFEFDRTSGRSTAVSAVLDPDSGSKTAPNGSSAEAVPSADGRFVAFSSSATDLIGSGDAPEVDGSMSQVYRWDAQTGETVQVSVRSDSDVDAPASPDDVSFQPTISGDGSRIGFISAATDLLGAEGVPKSDNHMTDAYVRLMDSGTTRRISLALLDESHPEITDSRGAHDPSTVRSRVWVEAGISTTRVSLAADGLSAVLTSMSPLLSIRGSCDGCQTFSDNNGAMDVYQVVLTADAEPVTMRPISVKMTNQDLSRDLLTMLRSSTTGGGDSLADGITPSTADGHLVAFSSQAGDLRGVSGSVQISSAGPPYWGTNRYLPVFVDGGEPDLVAQPVRTFTIAANSFNPHLHLPQRLQSALSAHPETIVGYEVRAHKLPPLDAAPAAMTLSGSVDVARITPGSTAHYTLAATARTAGSAEIVIDLDGFGLPAVTSIPAGWKQAGSDAPGSVSFVSPSVAAGASVTFGLDLKHDARDTAVSKRMSATSANDPTTVIGTDIAVGPATPSCTMPAEPYVVVPHVSKPLFSVQCRSSLEMTASAGHGSVSVSAAGRFSYEPASGYLGPDAITVFVTDSIGRRSAEVVIPLTVSAPFETRPDTYSTPAGANLAITPEKGLLANDVRPAGTAASHWRIQEGFAPEHGSMSVDAATGAFVFEPEDGFVGDVVVRYRVYGTGPYDTFESSVTTVTIHVTR